LKRPKGISLLTRRFALALGEKIKTRRRAFCCGNSQGNHPPPLPRRGRVRTERSFFVLILARIVRQPIGSGITSASHRTFRRPALVPPLLSKFATSFPTWVTSFQRRGNEFPADFAASEHRSQSPDSRCSVRARSGHEKPRSRFSPCGARSKAAVHPSSPRNWSLDSLGLCQTEGAVRQFSQSPSTDSSR
jgi:hypothetical protein